MLLQNNDMRCTVLCGKMIVFSAHYCIPGLVGYVLRTIGQTAENWSYYNLLLGGYPGR